MEFRPAREADLEGEYAVFVAAQRELHDRRGAEWSAPAEFDRQGRWARIHRHLLAHDGERSFVAEDEERIVGFTAAWVRGGIWFLSALFVEPAFQGLGLGHELLVAPGVDRTNADSRFPRRSSRSRLRSMRSAECFR